MVRPPRLVKAPYLRHELGGGILLRAAGSRLVAICAVHVTVFEPHKDLLGPEEYALSLDGGKNFCDISLNH